LLADKSDVDELQAETKRLEELAQTIFKEWFVNFNFPGATGEMEREVQDESINKNFEFEEILYLDTGSITENKIDDFQKHNLNEAPSRARRLVKNSSIVYSTVRPIQKHYGLLKNPPENLVVSTGFTVIDCKIEKSYPLFVYYLLSTDSKVQILDAIANGTVSTYPSIKPSDIEKLKITLLYQNKKPLQMFYHH